jgi:hypothetical protein
VEIAEIRPRAFQLSFLIMISLSLGDSSYDVMKHGMIFLIRKRVQNFFQLPIIVKRVSWFKKTEDYNQKHKRILILN